MTPTPTTPHIQLAAEEEAADEAAEAAAALPVGADIPVPAAELAWFIWRFRLKRWVGDHTATLAELQPVPKDGGLRELQVGRCVLRHQ